MYKGEWKEGRKNGLGELVIDDKYGYSGDWFDNKKEGNGSYIYSNG